MINPLDYLWYKIYKAQFFIGGKKKPLRDIPFMGCILGINMVCITWLIYGDIFDNFIIFIFILDTIIISPYFCTKKQAKIVKKYRHETEKYRIIGNTVIVIYIILTFAMPFIIAKCKNGYIIQ
jgi:hypothetical protein